MEVSNGHFLNCCIGDVSPPFGCSLRNSQSPGRLERHSVVVNVVLVDHVLTLDPGCLALPVTLLLYVSGVVEHRALAPPPRRRGTLPAPKHEGAQPGQVVVQIVEPLLL
eukprot:5328645-Pyramimonas_sp.AAC.1